MLTPIINLKHNDKVRIGYYKGADIVYREECVLRVNKVSGSPEPNLIVHTNYTRYDELLNNIDEIKIHCTHSKIIITSLVSPSTGIFTLPDRGCMIGGIITTNPALDFDNPIVNMGGLRKVHLLDALSSIGCDIVIKTNSPKDPSVIQLDQVPPRVVELMDIKLDEVTSYLPLLNGKLLSFINDNMLTPNVINLSLVQVIMILLSLISRLQMSPKRVVQAINECTNNDLPPASQLVKLMKILGEITSVYEELILMTYFNQILNKDSFSKAFIQALSWLMKPYLQTINTYLNGNIKNQLQNKITPEPNGGIRGARPIMYRKCRATAAIGHLSNKARII